MQKFLSKWGAAIIIGLLLLIAFFTIQTFRKTKGQDDDDYKEKVELLERERDAIGKERDALKSVLAQKDETIRQINRVDSLLQANISSNNKMIYEIDKQRKALSRFDNYSSDELKQFFSNLR